VGERPFPAQAAADAGIYGSVAVLALDASLVSIVASVAPPGGRRDAIAYARCTAAYYTLTRGYGFARHVRTRVVEEGSFFTADAVYTVSPALPRGALTVDAEVTAEDCAARGIPEY
jgi:hypothetical protein